VSRAPGHGSTGSHMCDLIGTEVEHVAAFAAGVWRQPGDGLRRSKRSHRTLSDQGVNRCGPQLPKLAQLELGSDKRAVGSLTNTLGSFTPVRTLQRFEDRCRGPRGIGLCGKG